jgi:hypothetical protein
VKQSRGLVREGNEFYFDETTALLDTTYLLPRQLAEHPCVLLHFQSWLLIAAARVLDRMR